MVVPTDVVFLVHGVEDRPCLEGGRGREGGEGVEERAGESKTGRGRDRDRNRVRDRERKRARTKQAAV